MSSIRILHAADLHLDSPFEGLPAAKAAQRRQEQRELLKKIAHTVEAEQVQLVLLAGDLLDSDSAYTETAEELVRVLGSMSVPVFISPGNHDFYSRRSPYARLAFPENVHIFTENRIECVELTQLSVRVWGAAFTDKYCPALLNGFRAEKKDGVLDLMCIHGEVGKGMQYDPITPQEIAASGMDYIALGHIHQASGLQKAGNTYYAWPGCPEGRGFDECGEKFVYIVDASDTDCELKPVTLAERRYEILPVELDGRQPLAAVQEALSGDTKSDIYRIILRGETDDAPDMNSLRQALEGRFYSLQLRDETVLRRDIWEKAGEDSLRGRFLQRLRSAYDMAKDESERERIVQAVRWGLAALDKREEVVTHDD